MKKGVIGVFIAAISVILVLVFSFTNIAAATYIKDGNWKYEIGPNRSEYYIDDYDGSEFRLFIPETFLDKPVTKINSEAFLNDFKLTYVTFSKNLVEIGNNAFSGCTALRTLDIPANISTLGNNAFNGCSALSVMTIYEGTQLKSIPANCFNSCTSMTSAIISHGLESIGDYSFYNNISLNLVIIPASVTTISDNAFDGCDKLTIYGWDNTAAQQYALEKNIPFVSYGTYVEPTTPPPTQPTSAPTSIVETSSVTTVVIPSSSAIISHPTTVVTDPVESTVAPTTVVTDPVESTVAPTTVIPTQTEVTYPISNPTYTMPISSEETETTETIPTTTPLVKYYIGDANLNSKISVKDATAIQKYVSKVIEFTRIQLFIANCDGVGGVNVKDATLIQKYVANYPISTVIGTEVYL